MSSFGVINLHKFQDPVRQFNSALFKLKFEFETAGGQYKLARPRKVSGKETIWVTLSAELCPLYI
jgi:hypothetical protein